MEGTPGQLFFETNLWSPTAGRNVVGDVEDTPGGVSSNTGESYAICNDCSCLRSSVVCSFFLLMFLPTEVVQLRSIEVEELQLSIQKELPSLRVALQA